MKPPSPLPFVSHNAGLSLFQELPVTSSGAMEWLSVDKELPFCPLHGCFPSNADLPRIMLPTFRIFGLLAKMTVAFDTVFGVRPW